MTRNHNHLETDSSSSRPSRTPRLRLKAKAPRTGYVDGAWWPRTNCLVEELPDLLAVLSVRLGPIDRVLYNVGEWGSTPAKLVTGGRTVHLDGYLHQPPASVEVLGLNRSRITLLVVDPTTDPDAAHATMMASATPRNAWTVDRLLAMSHPVDHVQSRQSGADQDRWESEGGSARGPTITGLSTTSTR